MMRGKSGKMRRDIIKRKTRRERCEELERAHLGKR
jgi:hypothetical protein